MSIINRQRKVSFMYANDNFTRTEEEFLQAQNLLLQDEIYNRPLERVKSNARKRTSSILARKKKKKPSCKVKTPASA